MQRKIHFILEDPAYTVFLSHEIQILTDQPHRIIK